MMLRPSARADGTSTIGPGSTVALDPRHRKSLLSARLGAPPGGARRTPTVAAGAGKDGFTPPITAAFPTYWLYFALRRGGGGRRDRHIFCHGGFHHARHRTHPQHVRDRPVLLADLHPRCLRLAVLRRTDGRHGGVSQRRGRHRRVARRHRRRRAHTRHWTGRLRGRSSLALRAVIAAAFAVPAAIAGYHAVLGLSQIGVPSLVWREVFAWIGAIVIGGTAWARMTVFAEPLPLRSSGASRNEPQPVLTGATHQG